MSIGVTAFAVGVFWLQWQPALPGVELLLGAGIAGLALVAAARASRRFRFALPVGACMIGLAWAGIAAHLRLDDALAPEDEGRDIELVGVVAGLPQQFENGLRFEFDVERASRPVPAHVSLAWYRGWNDEADELPESVAVHAGERWALTVRLKRPHGNANPHGYDYEAALLERGIRATGYVRRADGNRRLEAFVARPGYAVERLRERLRDRFMAELQASRYGGILIALAIGDQRAIDPW